MEVPIDGATALNLILDLWESPQVKQELERRGIRVILRDSESRSWLRRIADVCKTWR
jgi:hypothetical protein